MRRPQHDSGADPILNDTGEEDDNDPADCPSINYMFPVQNRGRKRKDGLREEDPQSVTQ